MRTGFSLDTRLVELVPDAEGVRYVKLGEFDRLEVQLGSGVSAGCLVAQDECSPLPAGSQFDAETGAFT